MANKTSGKTEAGQAEKLGLEARKAIDQLAKGMGVAATELWTIFVRQYVVRGANELFTAIIFFVAAYCLKDYIGLWALIPTVVGVGFVYGAINYLGNPKYYALNDIVSRIKEFKEESEKSKVSYY